MDDPYEMLAKVYRGESNVADHGEIGMISVDVIDSAIPGLERILADHGIVLGRVPTQSSNPIPCYTLVPVAMTVDDPAPPTEPRSTE